MTMTLDIERAAPPLEAMDTAATARAIRWMMHSRAAERIVGGPWAFHAEAACPAQIVHTRTGEDPIAALGGADTLRLPMTVAAAIVAAAEGRPDADPDVRRTLADLCRLEWGPCSDCGNDMDAVDLWTGRCAPCASTIRAALTDGETCPDCDRPGCYWADAAEQYCAREGIPCQR